MRRCVSTCARRRSRLSPTRVKVRSNRAQYPEFVTNLKRDVSFNRDRLIDLRSQLDYDRVVMPFMKSLFRVAKPICLLTFTLFAGVSCVVAAHLNLLFEAEKTIDEQLELGNDLAEFMQETNQLLLTMQDVESATRNFPEFEEKLAGFSVLCERALNEPKLTTRQENILRRHGRIDAILRKQEACFQRNSAAILELCKTLNDLDKNHPDDPVFDKIIEMLEGFCAEVKATSARL